MINVKVNTDVMLAACGFLSHKGNELYHFADEIYNLCDSLSGETPLSAVLMNIRRKANALAEYGRLTQKMSDALDDIQTMYIKYERHIEDVCTNI